MTGDTSLGMSVVVRVEPVHDAYEVVLEDGEELVLAHYDTSDGDHAREDAERWAAEVRGLLRAKGLRRHERSSENPRGNLGILPAGDR